MGQGTASRRLLLQVNSTSHGEETSSTESEVCDSVDDTEISSDWSKETDEGDDQRSRSQMKEIEQLPHRLVSTFPACGCSNGWQAVCFMYICTFVRYTETAARETLEQVMAEALSKSGFSRSAVRAVCLAVSGVNHPTDQQWILDWLRSDFYGLTCLIHLPL
ncbi:hypothetical protein Hanom_Chr11g01035611 [Helianthus anomalus]